MCSRGPISSTAIRLPWSGRWILISLASILLSQNLILCFSIGDTPHRIERGDSCKYLEDLPRLLVPSANGTQRHVLWPGCNMQKSPRFVRVYTHHTRSKVAVVMLDARELEEFPEMVRDMMSGKVESPELLKYYQAAAYSNMLYAMKHGYDFLYVGLFDNSVFPTERIPVWQRVAFLRGILPHYEYLFVLDSDAYVRVQAITVDDVVEHFNMTNDKIFLCPRDVGDYINIGVMLIRRASLSLSILEEWWAAPIVDPKLTTYLTDTWSLEQHVFNTIITNHPDAIVVVMPVTAMTSPEGAFIRHVWHLSGEEQRSKVLNDALGEIFSVFMHEVLFPERVNQAKEAFMQSSLGYTDPK